MIFTDNVLGVGTMNAVVAAANTLRTVVEPTKFCPNGRLPSPRFVDAT